MGRDNESPGQPAFPSMPAGKGDAMKVQMSQAVMLLAGLGMPSATWSMEKVQKRINGLPDKVTEDSDAGTGPLNELLAEIIQELGTENGSVTVEADPVEKIEKKKSKKGKPEKADKAAKPKNKDKKKKKVATGPTKPGVIMSIVEFLKAGSEKKPLTKEVLHEKLCKKFPDRDANSMRTTISIQVPSRLRVDRNIIVHKNERGYWCNANEK